MKFINTPWAKSSLLIIKVGGTDSCHFDWICHRAINESSSVVAMLFFCTHNTSTTTTTTVALLLMISLVARTLSIRQNPSV